MEIHNPLYKNQGIHVISCIFTVEKGITKILLIKRKNEPFKGMWALVGGALYNNEPLDVGMKREIKEKTGIENVELFLGNVYGNVDRSPVMRMVGISYLSVLDCKRVALLKETLKTSNCYWTPITEVSNLAYDHNIVLLDAINVLKEKIIHTNILKSLFPDGFTIPEIQKTYETILNKKLDRRNFRRKILSFPFIEDTNKEIFFEGKKPAKLYKFKEKIEDKSIF